MELVMNVVTAGLAVVAGLVVVATGLFSIATTLWGDLLESDPADNPPSQLEKAA